MSVTSTFSTPGTSTGHVPHTRKDQLENNKSEITIKIRVVKQMKSSH